jgi:hypothetical protein
VIQGRNRWIVVMNHNHDDIAIKLRSKDGWLQTPPESVPRMQAPQLCSEACASAFQAVNLRRGNSIEQYWNILNQIGKNWNLHVNS